MKKRIVTMTLGLLIAFGLCACGSTETKTQETSSEEIEAELEEEEEEVEKEEVAETTETVKEEASEVEEEVASEVEEEVASEVEATEEAIEEEIAGAYASLEEWIASEEKDVTVDAINQQLEASGLICDIDATGDKLILKYMFIELQDLPGTADEIYAAFDENLAPELEKAGKTMADTFKEAYNLLVNTVRVEVYNADDTELFAKDYDV